MVCAGESLGFQRDGQYVFCLKSSRYPDSLLAIYAPYTLVNSRPASHHILISCLVSPLLFSVQLY